MRYLPLLALIATGCSFDEGIKVGDIHGRIVLPHAAADRPVIDDAGNPIIVNDVRNIGPVYLGLYAGIQDGLAEYPAPMQGPVLSSDLPGDTFPYGGTSVGDIRFPCLESLQCRVVSGRFVDFDGIVDWFNDTIDQPVLDPNGDLVETGDYVSGQCYDLLNYTSDAEIRLTATTDRNEDGALDAADLDFVAEGENWVAEFDIYQQELFTDEETGEGFKLWGWMDAPSLQDSEFTSCDPTGGYQETEYNRDFFAGRPYTDLLNHPTVYIADGDWVSSVPYQIDTLDDGSIEITLDHLVGGN